MSNKKKTAITKASLAEILRYIKPSGASLIASLTLAFISALSSLAIPLIVGEAIDCIVSKGSVDFDTLLKYLFAILALTLLSALSQWLMSIFNNRITYKVLMDLRRDAFEKIHSLPISYLDTHKSGEIVSRIVSDADQFADGLLLGFTQFFTGVITIVGTLIFMLTISPLITLVVVILTPISLLVASFIAKKTYSMFSETSRIKGEETAIVNETVSNQKIVKAFCHEEKSLAEFDEVDRRLAKCSLKTVFFSSLTNPLTRFVNSLVYAAVGFTGALAVISNPVGFTVGGLSSFLGYANQYTKPFNEISGVIAELQGALASASRLLEFIRLDDEVKECENEKSRVLSQEETVVFDNISFSYTPEKELLKNISINAKAGMRVAIVGPTGCGKTTLINLLMRFYDVTDGAVLVDGIDVRDVKRRTLRKRFGMVLQDTWTRAGTIRDNIVIGKPDATDEEVVAAAKAAHSHSFIKRLPKGYDTYISESGGGLSQGEKQLLSITRVMLATPPMLILDEATSSIDTRTEARIQKAFAKLMNGRTTFIVAHRLSTIMSADLILVMKNGNIIEQGTHSSLLEKNGFYAKLYESQFAK